MASRPPVATTPGALYRWGQYATRYKWRVLGAWLLFLIILGGIGGTFRGQFNDAFTLPDTDSQSAYDLLLERFPTQSGDFATIVFQSDRDFRTDEGARAEIQAVLELAAAQPHVVAGEIESPLDRSDQISADGTVAYATVPFDDLAAEIPVSELEGFIAAVDAAQTDSLRIEQGGFIVEQAEFEEPGGETFIALIAAAIVLMLAFGSIIAMGVPLLVALAGLAAGFSGVFIVTNWLDIATFTPGIAAMIGLGVGIDYSLFIVTRYREGLHNGLSVENAVARAMDTAGRAVLFAGVVVLIAILGLVAAALPFMTAYAIAVVLVVGFTIAVALTLLPALLAIVGTRIDKWGIKRLQATASDPGTSFGTRIGRRIQQRPKLYATLSTAFLLILAIPVLDINLGFIDAGAAPPENHARQAYDLLADGFGPGFNAPFLVAIDGNGTPVDQGMLNELAEGIRAQEGVVNVAPPILNQAGDTAIIKIIPTMSLQDDAAKDLVDHLREETIPPYMAGTGNEAYVGGIAASFVDVVDKMVGRTPLFFLIVVGLSFVLLAVVFRSIVIALKAAIMNILSIAAAFGVVVAVFQWGWFGSLVGVDEGQPILAFMPMFLFSILFGLSMDYEVFLLSRIREAWVHGKSTPDAVVEGLGVTARVITAAAAIMVVVFLSFVLAPDPIGKQFGLGLAVAILVDATVVRMILVPATMELLGEWNWWFPSWLDRKVPRINVEGTTMPVGAEGVAD